MSCILVHGEVQRPHVLVNAAFTGERCVRRSVWSIRHPSDPVDCENEVACSLLFPKRMRYEAFSRACRALGISADSFRDLHTLALALEQSVDAGNARTIVRLLSQMTGDFDV